MYQSPNKKVNIFYDAEFTGLHQNTTLISIGLVTEYGSSFYAEFTDYDRDQVDDWIRNNVISNLIFKPDGTDIIRQEKFNPFTRSNSIQMKGTTADVREELGKWLVRVKEITDGRVIQIISDCYAYDWMLFNDLICDNGQAINLPNHISYIPIDISTMFFMMGVDPDISREEYCPTGELEAIKKIDMFTMPKGNVKHNSLWDAYLIKACYDKLTFKDTYFN